MICWRAASSFEDDGYEEEGMIQDAPVSLSSPIRSKPRVLRRSRSLLFLNNACFLSSESAFTTG